MLLEWGSLDVGGFEMTDHMLSKAESAHRVVRAARVASKKLRKQGLLVCTYEYLLVVFLYQLRLV